MARLNIEDQFWLDVIHVAVAVKDHDIAIGMTLRWLRFAQEQHKSGRLVSDQEFTDQKFHESLIPYFATRVDGGIMARGSDKHFGWLQRRREAGRNGGKQTQANRSKLKQVQASPSYSPSFSKKNTNTVLAKAHALTDSLFSDFWNTWPRRVKKTAASKAWAKIVDKSQVPKAVTQYKIFIEKNAIEPKFVMHPATFLNSYTDWLDYDPTKETGGQPHKEGFLEYMKRKEAAL